MMLCYNQKTSLLAKNQRCHQEGLIMNLKSVVKVNLSAAFCLLIFTVLPTTSLYARQDRMPPGQEMRPVVPQSRPTGTVVTPGVPPGIVVPVPVPKIKPSPVYKTKPASAPHYSSPVVLENKNPPQKRRPEKRDYRGEQEWRRPHDKYHDDRYYKYRSKYRYGTVHHSLPPNIFRFSIGPTLFFYSSGIYYRQGAGGYVVVEAPVGARVSVLPENCSYFYYNGRRCYACDDVFYEEIGRDYVVIERPPRFDAIVGTGDEVRVAVDTLNVRSGPGKNYRVVEQLYRGDVVEIRAIEDGWYYVRFANKTYGWIQRRYTHLYRVLEDAKG